MEDAPIDTVAAVYSLQLSIADFVFPRLHLLIPDNNSLLDITSKSMTEGEGAREETGGKKVCAQDDLVVNRFVSHMRWTQGNRQVKQTERGGGEGRGSSKRAPR